MRLTDGMMSSFGQMLEVTAAKSSSWTVVDFVKDKRQLSSEARDGTPLVYLLAF
jgi:hypothetical protein